MQRGLPLEVEGGQGDRWSKGACLSKWREGRGTAGQRGPATRCGGRAGGPEAIQSGLLHARPDEAEKQHAERHNRRGRKLSQ